MRQIFLIMIGLSVSIWADFTRDSTTQIVTDTNTKLQWQDNEIVSKKWTEAIDYCEALTLGGYNDWRLPNQNELRSIADRSKNKPAISSTFQNVVSNYYWSSSTVVGYEYLAWSVYFRYGYEYWGGKSGVSYVRCVRDGQ